MKNIIIGIDPDSDKHGVAIYVDGELKKLSSYTIMNFIIWLNHRDMDHGRNVEIHIEDVCANSAVYRNKGNVNIQQRLARDLGKCQQSQIELERVFKHFDIPVIKHKISKNWKDSKTGKVLLERHTGWTGKSNEDTRSGAWFGYLGVQMNKRK